MLKPPARVLRFLWRAFMLAATILVISPGGIGRLLYRRQEGPLRSLWADTPMLILPTNAKAESDLGVHTATLAYETYFITDDFDYDLSRCHKSSGFGMLLPYFVFVWACWRFGRFHFFCHVGLLPQHERGQFNRFELALHRWLGKQVFFWTCSADNHRHFKGTGYLLAAVDRLKAEGYPLELRLVERIPNDRAEQLESVLRELADDRRRLHDLGVRGRRYVEKYFTPGAFAQRLPDAYQDLGANCA